MDKKLLLSKSLADFMKIHLDDINDLVQRFPQASVQYKDDSSPVTELDLRLSGHIENLFQENFPQIRFYSEEKYTEIAFPLLALDPLDGTREYVAGRPEWAVSLGLFASTDFKGEGWVYNPMTKECFDKAESIPYVSKASYKGEVSRSEWSKGIYSSRDKSRFQISPMGSIAYKLGRLSQGKIDFVVSLFPKSIWDVAGGSLLCRDAGLKFYSQGKEVTSVQKTYQPPLIWCHEELFQELSKIYS